MKSLVAYFSCSGVTASVAEALASTVKADLYEIKPAAPYTPADLNWHDKQSRSSVEMNDPSSRPAIAGSLPNMGDYSVVFVGFPIWWYTAPTIIDTFLESYDFSGKIMIPFATSGGSGVDGAEEKLHKLCPAAHWRKGALLNGTQTSSSLEKWIRELKL